MSEWQNETIRKAREVKKDAETDPELGDCTDLAIDEALMEARNRIEPHLKREGKNIIIPYKEWEKIEKDIWGTENWKLGIRK